MEMTMSAVSVGTVPVNRTNTFSDSSLDSCFLGVLSDVRGSVKGQSQPESAANGVYSVSEQSDAAAQAPVQPAEATEVQATEQTFTSAVSEEPTDSLDDAVAELVQLLTEESGDEQDTVISALLEILKKMQKNDEGDETVAAVMELLMSMLGQNVQVLQPTVVAVTIPEPSEEVAQITSEQPQASVTNTVQLSENIAETGVVQENNADEKVTVPEQTVPLDNPEQTVQSETTVPAVNAESDAQQLLNELLSQAREELGLTKAEIKPKSDGFAESVNPDSTENSFEQPMQSGQSVQSEQSFDTFALRLNHRDGTQELDSIIQSDEQTETKQVETVPDQMAILQPETHEIRPVPEEQAQVHAAPPEQQLAEEILSKTEFLNGGRTEFTMELNPETLGKITVKLVSAQGRVEVSISAENEETGRLLQSRGENISTALRESGIELERYQVVSEREEAQLMQDSYDGSSKNPYSRDDEENPDNQDDGEFLELLSQL